MSDWCSDPWSERRDAEWAARRGYMNYDERDKYNEGRYASLGSCEREFHDAYDREKRRIEERKEEERREEEAADRRRAEAIEYERQMEAAYYEQQRQEMEDSPR